MTKINRRDFIKLSGATAALAGTPSILKAGEESFEARVVVVGGGFAGATVAKYLRLWGAGAIKVTMVDKNPEHVSCVLSNLILNDRLLLDDITMSYDPLINHGVIVKEGLVTKIEDNGGVKTVQLNNETSNTIQCDYVVLAPGIEFVDVPGLKEGDTNNFDDIPHAWIAGEQTEVLRQQLHDMPNDGTGVFVMTVPQSPYRCPPGPYERACVVADYMLREKNGGKVIVLDPHADITIEKDTFNAAFTGIYKDIIEYIPNAKLISVNAEEKSLIIGQNDPDGAFIHEQNNPDGVPNQEPKNYSGDVVNVIPTHKAGKIIKDLDLNVGNWAPVDVRSYESTVKTGFYIIGDSNNSGQPKSGHMANSQAKVCADAIIRTIADSSKTLVHDETRLANLKTNSACYSPITYNEASWLTAVFAYETVQNAENLTDDSFGKMSLVDESFGWSTGEDHWSAENFEDMFEWSRSLFSNTFG